jgi:hypothetical protein
MLAINDKDKFNKIVSDAIENVAVTVNNERLAKRWINAIEKTVDLVESQSEFITWNGRGGADVRDRHAPR